MKMTLTTDKDGNVTLAYDDILSLEGGRIVRKFTVGLEGGIVQERAGNHWRPACKLLETEGETLAVSSRRALPGAIRYQYHAMRRIERRELDRLQGDAALREVLRERRNAS
jgi:hypothetical protein